MEVKRNKDAINHIQVALGYEGSLSTDEEVHSLTKLDESDTEYQSIATRIRLVKPTIGDVVVTSIEKVFNPYTLALYNLKKSEMDGFECELWHGTKESNVDLICKNNLNYRLVRQYKFGKGVSFSKYFSYAFHYSVSNRPMFNMEYCVFLCKVIKNRCHIGRQGLIYPIIGYDSTMKSDEDVIVKYDDDTFYPMYKIGFTIKRRNCP
ncbi:PREDICTED: poly [ADP-ribose] polymerase 12-like [Nicrophorus vespilloides]|uniref:Poly [ADP-ribose] polymerase n=1 Tax=Nicrophorus vespilloides TaxID=110193 RepID=A0ABM1MCC4_NICVS|nr:PREDICTED: poly [ADP-ribose] polymerase 12-like [Nicrophorus vespilloides]